MKRKPDWIERCLCELFGPQAGNVSHVLMQHDRRTSTSYSLGWIALPELVDALRRAERVAKKRKAGRR